jgi:hypothetical protein
LALTAFFYENRMKPHRFRPWQASTYILLSLGVLGILGESLWHNAHQSNGDAVVHTRNFYGNLKVSVNHSGDPERMTFTLEHGRISHGCQFAAADRRRQATTYYSHRSGIGLALLNLPRQSGLRVGVVGLGTGTLAAYGRDGDRFTFYEINPAVKDIAASRFTYLSDSYADCDIVIGDARVSLSARIPRSSTSWSGRLQQRCYSVHLLTLEAFETYLRHLKKDGVLPAHHQPLSGPQAGGQQHRRPFSARRRPDLFGFRGSRGNRCGHLDAPDPQHGFP